MKFKLSILIAVILLFNSCDDKKKFIENFLPKYWVILGIEKNEINVLQELSINSFSLMEDGTCHLPGMLSDELSKKDDGVWRIEKSKSNYKLIFDVHENLLSDTFLVNFQTDTVNSVPVVSMLMESRTCKVWAVKQFERPDPNKMKVLEKINN